MIIKHILSEFQSGRLTLTEFEAAPLTQGVEEMNPYLKAAQEVFEGRELNSTTLAFSRLLSLSLFNPDPIDSGPLRYSKEWRELRILVLCFAAAMWETGDI